LWKIRGNDSAKVFPAQIVESVLVMTPAAPGMDQDHPAAAF